MRRRWRAAITGAACAVALGCGADAGGGAFTDHDESADFQPFDSAKADGVAEFFTADFIMDDALFTASAAIDAAAVQSFFESTPYGGRSFLADATTGGVPASEAVVAAATAHGLNPLVLLVRMQVENSLVGKSSAPSPSTLDFAFGCGCSDGRSCSEAYRGFDQQLDCAATTLREQYDAASDGGGLWPVGVPKKSQDGVLVTPQNAATASLYAYTPWVLEGRGGNWLVWNVTGRYLAAFADAGVQIDPGGAPEFIGSPCDVDDAGACGFSNAGDEGFCLGYHEGTNAYGMCSIDCAGLCPDQPGTLGADTLCVELEAGFGSCLPVATPDNGDCGAIPGTLALEVDRFVGDSGAAPRTAVVCMPNAVDSTAPGDVASCVGYCGTGTAVPDGNGNACFCDTTCVIQGDCCDDYEMVCAG